MAARKTLKFLPAVFQTDVNSKFLAATLDQLMAEPSLKNIYGYVGRKFAPTFKSKDSYIVEDTAERQNYQLEASIVVRNNQKNITFFASYSDLLNQIEYYGGFTNDQSRLFGNEYYSFNPHISFDAFVNFTQYFWLPNGPDAVDVFAGGVDLEKTYTVIRNADTNTYQFSTDGAINNTLILARGGQYKFVIDQPGYPFWLQSELGIDGKINAIPDDSSRDVIGVVNNGAESGIISFLVPFIDAQDRFVTMNTVANVDYAIPHAYSEINGRLMSDIVASYPKYASISSQMNGKTLIFVDQNLLTNYGEAAWTKVNGEIIPTEQRTGAWQIVFDSSTAIDPIINLAFVQAINFNEKAYVKSGVDYSNSSFYTEIDTLLRRVPLITSIQDTLFFQDGVDPKMYGQCKLVDATGWTIDVDTDIIGKLNYTSPNKVKLTNGLKITFDSSVTPATYQYKTYYVEGVGRGIQLIDAELLVTPEKYNDELALNYPNESFPDYITINRSSKDLNAWSRNNRWFHRDVIFDTATYNSVVPKFDQLARAQRPIIEFDGSLQLFNNGRVGKKHVDILDTTILDAFTEVEGKPWSTIFGIDLTNGMRIVFANNLDPLVRKKIYTIKLVQYHLDEFDQPMGDFHIKLDIADDGILEKYDTIVENTGDKKGSQWWFDGNNWVAAQAKIGLNQDPLFDIVNSANTSISEYDASTFTGTRLFGYKRKTTGTRDLVLKFALSYRNFSTQGDIEFQNYFDTDTFSYNVSGTPINANISLGFLSTTNSSTPILSNIWKTVTETSRQDQLITFVYDGSTNIFTLDVVPSAETTIPHLKVFQNFSILKSAMWSFNTLTKELTVMATMTAGDKIDILIYSKEVSELGYYQVPLNLDLNAQNIDLSSLTLGQMRNHLVELSNNSKHIVGEILGPNNLRDIDIKSHGGNILQHSAPASHAALFLLHEDINFVNSIRFAQQEYFRFKNKFLEYSTTLAGLITTDPVGSVDLIITEINKLKNSEFPWHYSDMVPYGPLKTIVNDVGYTIFDPLVRSYEITNVFNSEQLSNRAVIIYHNGTQLILGTDYTFAQDRPAITLLASVHLQVDDIIEIVEYSNTDGNYIPETPTKLGLYPKFIPAIYKDDTYRTSINVIRGHDGSITPAFDDYRDSFLLELENRIYNNIKLPDTGSYQHMYQVMPGKFRTSDYSLTEANRLLSTSFLNWIGNNKLDYSTNETFDSNDSFTWNYSRFADRISGELLPGSWRACYRYFYDCEAPHQRPWEMLGFSIQPDWWDSEYGSAPYTGGNSLLWEDLELGLIKGGKRAGIDKTFARPGLTSIIPIDENGNLKSPAAIMTAEFDSKYATTSWAVGNQGPVENAWRKSSEFPFAVQLAQALANPGKYFGLFADVNTYANNNRVAQYLTPTNSHIKQNNILINGDNRTDKVVRAAGYLNWIGARLQNLGISPVEKIESILTDYEVNLSYKLAGFTDQKYLQILAEQSSPTSTNDSIIVPNESYAVHLFKSPAVEKIIYSGIIVEKTNNGFSVRGYNLTHPYFTIIPSQVNANATKITVLEKQVTIFNEYQNLKVTVPYGYEFKTQQQVVDFFISYGRYLNSQGFVFDNPDRDLNELRNWTLSSKEFIFWAQQGWPIGSILVLSPVVDRIDVITTASIVDGISDSHYGTKVLDQNFNLVNANNYNVLRTPTEFKLELTNGQVIGLIELNLVQYEHVLILDNTTVFNDIIYKPELGNRQFRLKLIGQKTADWDGSLSAPGFIYNSGEVRVWAAGTDYLKGDLIQYKNQYYVALYKIIASDLFDFSQWTTADYSQFKKGLLPNFSSNAMKSQSYYDSYGYFNDAEDIKYSHGLIGFKPRQYLDDLGLNETTQVEFYKGFIAQKGTANAVNALTTAQFNNSNSSIKYFEEWALRVGEYGAIDTNPYIEVQLDEAVFANNPTLLDLSLGIGLYKSTIQYNGTIAFNRDDTSDYENDIPTAGYVNIDDIDESVFDMNDINLLNNELTNMSDGYTIWTAKDFISQWNVFRVSETAAVIIAVSNSLDGFITFTTDVEHKVSPGDIIMIRAIDDNFDGFYLINNVLDSTNFIVTYHGELQALIDLTTIETAGELFTLHSLRFAQMSDVANYSPAKGWSIGERIWVDSNPATYEEQQLTNFSDIWKVYERSSLGKWEVVLVQQPTIDTASIDRVYMYSKKTSTILINLEFIDPAKGKILGQAEQELTYKTAYDPAIYNRGTNIKSNINNDVYWTSVQQGQVWWNLDQVRYIDYEQSTLAYRSINWARLFPGSTIEVLEWVESSVLPSKYVAAGLNGVPKYEDDSAYVESTFVDTSNIVTRVYYFWVKNKTSLDVINSTRRLPIDIIQKLIENPKSNGAAYAAIISTSALTMYNIGEYLSADDTIVHVDYKLTKNSNVIHSEYELLQQGNTSAANQIPFKIINKLIDSLSGLNIAGEVVPDPELSVADRYGISIRPRQTMFVDRPAALTVLIDFANSIFAAHPISAEYKLTNLNLEEAQPNLKLGECDQLVETDEMLAFIDVHQLMSGHKVLVKVDTTQDGRWSLHELSKDKTWTLIRTQTYKTNLYWEYIDWYASGYDTSTKTTYAVNSMVDAKKLPYAIGNIIKINNTGRGTWQLVTVNSTREFEIIAIQNGTIKLNSTRLTDSTVVPSQEIRTIISALREDIFIGLLANKFNDLFFTLVNYLFIEQKYVDWIFKTSFITVIHKLRGLEQTSNYVKDNQTCYQNYIEEVKPYKTKIREYLINYDGNDIMQGNITDFDLPSYYDNTAKMFRSPSGENVVLDEQIWQTEPYVQWYNNRNYQISEIIVDKAGINYTLPPVVEIYGNGTGATAHAIIDADTGRVVEIIVDTHGQGYSRTVVIKLNGNGQGATASAVIKNNQVRTFDVTVKFDRVGYTSNVKQWLPNTVYATGDIISYGGVGYAVTNGITTGKSFIADDYTVYPSANFTTANDRIMAYYNPTDYMPAKDLKQLVSGIDYPGVQVQGLDFDQQPGFDRYDKFDSRLFDQVQYDENGIPILDDSAIDSIIRSTYTDFALGTRAEDINVDGGAYVDTYSGHAPEELVPGIMFDTLDMRIYTTVAYSKKSDAVLGYRIFNNMLGETNYFRISENSSTKLAQPLQYNDTVIQVSDASVLIVPNPAAAVPGVVFIGSERVTYYTIDLTTNTLGQIRRGTQGTGVPTVHPLDADVVDASIMQRVPDANFVNKIWYRAGKTTAANGSGFSDSRTAPINFLRQSPAYLTGSNSGVFSNNLLTEDDVDTLNTESGTDISEE